MNENDRLIILMNEAKRTHDALVKRWCEGDSSEKLIRLIQKIDKRWHRRHRKALQLHEEQP
jgi:hypothetical protein